MAKWDGTFRIRQRLSTDVHLVDQGRSLVKIHVSQIKPCHQGDATIPLSSDQEVAAPTSSLSATPIHFNGDQEVAAPTSSLSATPIHFSGD